MHRSNRRTFIKHSSISLAATLLPVDELLAGSKKTKPKLSFSTLGCPNWSLQDVVTFAAKNKYHGVELRAISGELDLNKCTDFNPANINASKRKFVDNNLKITDLGSSANMHFKDAASRNENLDGAKRYIDLAQRLGSPYVRVFPNRLPDDNNRKATLDIIAENLNQLSAYAKGSNVKVLMETHGDVVITKDILYVMEQTANNNIGLIWDFVNMWFVTKEPPLEVYKQLRKYIHHVHVKDLKIVNGKEQYVLLGTGEAPVKEAIQLLYKDNFNGFYSFEWEKMWHPEIEEPEIALAHYPGAINNYFK